MAVPRTLALPLLFALAPALAWGTAFRLDGRLNLELGVADDFDKANLDKEAVFEVETRRKEGLRAVSDARISTESRGFELRELYLDYKSEGGTRWVGGQAKKRFGLSWDYSLEEVLTLTRGAVYDKLSTLAFTGRDSTVGFEKGAHALSAHTSEGINGALLYRYTRELGEGGDRFHSYTLLHLDRIDQRLAKLAGAQSFAYASYRGEMRYEAELFAGVDAFESEFNDLLGTSRRVYFAAASVAALWSPGKFAPFGKIGILFPDLQDAPGQTIELTAGARYHFLSNSYAGLELKLLRTRFEETVDLESGSHLLLALRYFF